MVVVEAGAGGERGERRGRGQGGGGGGGLGKGGTSRMLEGCLCVRVPTLVGDVCSGGVCMCQSVNQSVFYFVSFHSKVILD